MASKIKVKMLEKEDPETQSDRPLLDLSAAAFRELIRNAKKRGYVTHDQIDALLSSEEVKSEQNRGHPGEFQRGGRQRGRHQGGRA
jgi:RNA polymerase primary sigma factor